MYVKVPWVRWSVRVQVSSMNDDKPASLIQLQFSERRATSKDRILELAT